MNTHIFVFVFLGIAPLVAVVNTYLKLWRNSFSTYISSVCMGVFSLSNPALEWYNALLFLATLVLLEFRAIRKPLTDRFWNFKRENYGY